MSTLGQTHSLQSIAMGQLGADWLDDTTLRTGDWGAITCMVDATFSSLLTSTFKKNGSIVTDLGAISLPKGVTLYGKFSSLQLAAGTIVCYRASVAVS